MAKRFTYGVFILDKDGQMRRGGRWKRTNNKAFAIAMIKKHGGEVWAMPYAHGDQSYDAPTFKMGAKKIFSA